MIQYKHIPLQDTVKIDSIVNASRQKVGKNFVFEGESHNFWEMQYAALGTAIICTKNEFYELRQGQLTFFHPINFMFYMEMDTGLLNFGSFLFAATRRLWKNLIKSSSILRLKYNN